jgi:cyclic pyranopterin phosphate synthase
MTKTNKQSSCLGIVDISQKDITVRTAIANAYITFDQKAFSLLLKQGSPKGNLFETARIAGIMAAKATPNIIPLCHPLNLDKVKIDIEVVSTGKTGVEMEALAAVSAAALTIYDMMKWTGQTMTIAEVKLLHKSGGKSGTYNRSRD